MTEYLRLCTRRDPVHRESVYSDRSNLQLTSKSGQAIQSAIVIIDPQGNIVGLAGALGEKSSNRGWNYASRSCGSRAPPSSR